jgi:hypothetical protein
MLRSNSPIRRWLGPEGTEFIEHAAGAIQRILPHVEITGWDEVPRDQVPLEEAKSVWLNSKRKEIRVILPVGSQDPEIGNRVLTTIVRRRRVPVARQIAGQTLDTREFDICRRIALRIDEIIQGNPLLMSAATMKAVRDVFDEGVIADHITNHQHGDYHSLIMSMSGLFSYLHKLSEQTYENRSLTFGCVVDSTKSSGSNAAEFPKEFLEAKKYKALSDGFRTAYYVSRDGHLLDFLDLDVSEKNGCSADTMYIPTGPNRWLG